MASFSGARDGTALETTHSGNADGVFISDVNILDSDLDVVYNLRD